MPLAIAAHRTAGRSQPQQHQQPAGLQGGYGQATSSSSTAPAGSRSTTERDPQPASRGRRVGVSKEVTCSSPAIGVGADGRAESSQQSRRRWLSERQMDLDRVRAELRGGSPQPAGNDGGGRISPSLGAGSSISHIAERMRLRESLRRARSPGSAVGGPLSGLDSGNSSDIFQAVTLVSPRRDRLSLATARQQRHRSPDVFPVPDGYETDEANEQKETQVRGMPAVGGQAPQFHKLRPRSVDDASRSLARAREDAALRRLSQANSGAARGRQQAENLARIGAKPVDGGESSPRGFLEQRVGVALAGSLTSAASSGPAPAKSSSGGNPPQTASAKASAAVQASSVSNSATAPSAPEGSQAEQSVKDEEERAQMLRETERVLKALQDQKERLMGAYEAAGGDLDECNAVLADAEQTLKQEQAATANAAPANGHEQAATATPNGSGVAHTVDPLGVSHRRLTATAAAKLNVPMVPLSSMRQRQFVTAQGVVLARPSPFRQDSGQGDLERIRANGSPSAPGAMMGLTPSGPSMERLRASSPSVVAEKVRPASPPPATPSQRRGASPGKHATHGPLGSPRGALNSPRGQKRAEAATVQGMPVPHLAHNLPANVSWPPSGNTQSFGSLVGVPMVAIDPLSQSTRSVSQGSLSIQQSPSGMQRVVPSRPVGMVASPPTAQPWQYSPRGAAPPPPVPGMGMGVARKQSFGMLLPDQGNTRAMTSPRTMMRPVPMMRPSMQISGGQASSASFSSVGVNSGFAPRVAVPGVATQSWQPAATMSRSASQAG